ncbi:MAG: SDR family oxidoreductase [Parvibaculum sp.]|uniref:SDR family oxidoreductase n=1 Tax=Parvibaculum sp. TaxID=2024848 RepID=UPI0025D43D39|nr:SDR family oxidoreductase [Parvibaculum sp.]MCE9651267.1 SDR family oxidoreductase [Parvibaculum sp.]
MAGRLEGKVAIITGGTSGIGLGAVDLFLREGAEVVCGDLQDHKGEAMAKAYGAGFSYCRTDVSQEADVKALVDHAVGKFGKLDVMFNNAGLVGVTGDLDAIDMNGFDETVGVLLKGVFLGYKYATPQMKKQKSGSIISTASVAGLQAGMAPHVYSVCKAGVRHLARVASVELAPYNIRSNAICPGGISTSIFGGLAGMGTQVADQFAVFLKSRLAKIQPIARAGLPNDIAETALFLASDASTFITGQAITVDGGLTAGPPTNLMQLLDLENAIAEFQAQMPS